MTDDQFDALMNRMKKKDMSALKDIYEAYSGYVYHIVFSIIGQKEDSEDIASDVFVSLFEKAGQFKTGGSHRGYLATIARNKAYDFLKKQSHLVVGDEYFETAADETEDDVVKQMDVEHLLNKLSPEERQIVHLHFFGGLKFCEIASILGIPEGTVNWKYSNIKKVLRRYEYA